MSGVGFRFSVFGFRDSGFGFRVSCSGLQVSCFVLRVLCFVFRVSIFVFQVSGFVFRVPGFGFRLGVLSVLGFRVPDVWRHLGAPPRLAPSTLGSRGSCRVPEIHVSGGSESCVSEASWEGALPPNLQA